MRFYTAPDQKDFSLNQWCSRTAMAANVCFGREERPTSGSDDINAHRLQLAAGVRTAQLNDSTSFTSENIA